MPKPLVSVIVPTKNSARALEHLLGSITESDYKNVEVIINDDISSNDDSRAVAADFTQNGLSVIYRKDNHSMAQGRKRGVDFSSGDILMHLDSDMAVSEGLIGECVSLIGDGADALVIPEESYGTTFWAKCKWLEKKCYEGVQQIESLRCLRANVYHGVGGHNENMVFSEDKDLDIRVRNTGAKVARTKHYILHDEGNLTFWNTVLKKGNYAATANLFAKAHPKEFRWQANILNRYAIFLMNIRYLLSHPMFYLGMLTLKTAEYAYSGASLVSRKARRFAENSLRTSGGGKQ